MVLTPQEKYKLDIVNQVNRKQIKTDLAAKLLGISQRQIRRLRVALRNFGEQAVVHKLKGKPGNHHIDIAVKEKALTAIKDKYADFKPLFASEKLGENHNIHITSQTIRVWMTEEKLWKSRKQKQSVYRS